MSLGTAFVLPVHIDAGVNENLDPKNMYEEKPFDYNTLYKDGKKRTPASSKSSLEAAKEANSKDWNYRVPGGDSQAFDNASNYNYYLVRGFAVVSACGIGTYGSEGFELCGRCTKTRMSPTATMQTYGTQ